METHFPHLTTGMRATAPSRLSRTRQWRTIWVAIGIASCLILSASYAFASTMNQDMIAQQEKLQAEVCYELKKDINSVMYSLFITQNIDDLQTEQAKRLEMLTASYANYCKN